MLPAKNRLRKEVIFKAVLRNGVFFASPFFKVKFFPSKFSRPQIAFVARKKIFPKAVQRNHVTRRLRESFRANLEFAPPVCAIFLAKKKCENDDFEKIKKEILRFFTFAKVNSENKK
jgi:ribonuclease P protein component